MGAIKTVTEWRVTGDPTTTVVHPSGQPFEMSFPPYHFVWYSNQTYDERSRPVHPNALPGAPGGAEFWLSAEEAARRFMRVARDWKEGPFLHKRTVTYTEWEEQ